MSKKWANAPQALSLRPFTPNRSDAAPARQEDDLSVSDIIILPPEVEDAARRHDSQLSDAQYVLAAPSRHLDQYLDLPSAVPFQDGLSPSLPSAEFPSSARFVSTPSTATGFPDLASSSANGSFQHTTSPLAHIRSNLVRPGEQSAAHLPIKDEPPSGATALSRADSSVSYDSVWSGEGSQQHILLDITQFPRPPQDQSDESSSTRSSPTVAHFHAPRKHSRVRPPASPLYEVSEPSASRPLTPNLGEVSYQYPVAATSQQQSSTTLDSSQDEDSLIIQYLRPQSDSLLPPPSPIASGRASYQSHLTAASRGSSVPRMSMEGPSSRASEVPDAAPAWDQVMNAVKPRRDSTSRISVPHSTAVSTYSTNVAVAASVGGRVESSDGGTGSYLDAPGLPPSTIISPLSAETGSDPYSAFRRMSFPNPPAMHAAPESKEEQDDELERASSPISPGHPRSPWVTGVTLKTSTSRGSLKRRADAARMTSPRTALTPLSLHRPVDADALAAETPAPPLLDVQPPVDNRADVTDASSEKDLLRASVKLAPSSEAGASSLSLHAPSYDRRVSDLLRAAAASPARNSVASTGASGSDSRRSSVDGAVVGIARAASLSVRARVLLTRGPSITTPVPARAEGASYVVPSPTSSTGPSENTLTLAPSIVRRVASGQSPSSELDEETRRERSLALSPSTSTPPIPAFPESIHSFDDRGIALYPKGMRSRDIPHSAVPLNQSTPFQNNFPYPDTLSPSSYRNKRPDGMDTGPFTPVSGLHRSQSKGKAKRGSALSILSRASSRATKGFSWFRKKPLPPLPPSPTKEKYGPNPDEDLGIQDLARRAAAMDRYLAVGELPYNSPINSPVQAGARNTRLSVHSVLSSLSDRARAERRARSAGFAQLPDGKLEANLAQKETTSSPLSRKRRWITCFVFFWCIVALAVPIGIVFGRRALAASSASNCPVGSAGATCQLNSICVCTSQLSGRCDPVAQSLVDLVPTVNDVFGLNITPNSLALSLWDLQGQPAGQCDSQALIVDVSPSLNQTKSPNRTHWARSAILYTLLRTNDLSSAEEFRKLVASADLTELQGQDGPVTTGLSNAVIPGSGFQFDLARMTFSAKAVSWVNVSGVDANQVSRVGSAAGRALDRMYSFASASSTQRSTALKRYWTKVLQGSEDTLPQFISALASAPIVLPFDAAAGTISEFLAGAASSDNASFPPPLACYPGLSGQDRNNIDTLERHAFDLPSLGTPPSSFEPACFPDRPVYGTLDVFRLRRPFDDSRGTMRVTAAQLISQAGSRAVVHTGEQVVGLTGFPDIIPANLTAKDVDAREYGTLQHLDHLALSYLEGFPSTDMAKLAVNFIASAHEGTTPPTSGNPLFDSSNGLADLPTLEVAIFGTVLPTDVDIFRADFATPNGTLFFGSKSGDIFRKWALRGPTDDIAWSNSSTASQAVHETAANNSAFEGVWTQASDMISAAAIVGRGTGRPEVTQILTALRNASLFS